MANSGIKNIEAHKIRTAEEAREKGRNGGEASGKARKEKADLKKRLKVLMEMEADPKVAAAMSKTGIDVHDNMDVVIAGMMKGVMKSNPQMTEKVLKLLGQDESEAQKLAKAELELEKMRLEIERQELENEKQKIWLEAVKAQQGQGEELPDDGFIDALSGSALEDWSNESI